MSIDLLNPKNYTDKIDQLLCILYNHYLSSEDKWIDLSSLSRILLDDYNINLHWKTILSLFESNKNLIKRKKIRGKWNFIILQDGIDRIKRSSKPITFIDPMRAFQEVLNLHDFLSKLEGEVKICDPYLDQTTFEHIRSINKNNMIKLLTSNIKDNGQLKQYHNALITEGYNIVVMKTNKPILHDRYIIDKNLMIILGTSLNGFGKKQSFIIKAGNDIKIIMQKEFNNIWSSSSTW